MIILNGCSDPRLYETPLPNGYMHHSNGGEFGVIIKPKSMNGGPIKPLAMQNDGSEFWCNEFGVQGQWVVCKVIEYGERLIDPPVSKQYLALDTVTGLYKTYKTNFQLETEWRRNEKLPLPKLSKMHKETKSI